VETVEGQGRGQGCQERDGNGKRGRGCSVRLKRQGDGIHRARLCMGGVKGAEKECGKGATGKPGKPYYSIHTVLYFSMCSMIHNVYLCTAPYLATVVL
jgi:hypothetical protein